MLPVSIRENPLPGVIDRPRDHRSYRPAAGAASDPRRSVPVFPVMTIPEKISAPPVARRGKMGQD
jgi:hypothetical protein